MQSVLCTNKVMKSCREQGLLPSLLGVCGGNERKKARKSLGVASCSPKKLRSCFPQFRRLEKQFRTQAENVCVPLEILSQRF